MNLQATGAADILVTALMPVKNYHPEFLKQAVESVFSQTSPRWKLLIIVEPSDESASLAAQAQIAGNPKARIVVNRGRKLAGAFNTGMSAAETDYVAILLADDRWTADAVEVLEHNVRSAAAADLFHSGRRHIDATGSRIGPQMKPAQNASARDFLRGSPVKHLICWRRAKALSFGGMDESLNNVGPDDFDFPWCMIEHGAVVQAVDHCLYEYRVHQECYRLTTHLPRSIHLREIRRMLRKHRVSRVQTFAYLWMARRGFLRACLYRNPAHEWIYRNLLNREPRGRWHKAIRLVERQTRDSAGT
ncbi:MAG TPA: glycosyltransferase [Candidatus Binataceae bacterium]|nr:glycosyltransferase [Candidatus Binataceae bacterium]